MTDKRRHPGRVRKRWDKGRRTSALVFCTALLGACGGSAPSILPPASAQTPSCGPAWFDAWSVETGSWCQIEPLVTQYTTNSDRPIGVMATAHSAAVLSGSRAPVAAGVFNGVNDAGISTWGVSAECNNMVSKGDCIGLEIEVGNNQPAVPLSPNAQPRPTTPGNQIGCGAGWPNSPPNVTCSAAVNVVSNPGVFLAGINIMRGAVQGPTAPVLQLPSGSCIYWYATDGTVTNKVCG